MLRSKIGWEGNEMGLREQKFRFLGRAREWDCCPSP